jgi:hypothetical protein
MFKRTQIAIIGSNLVNYITAKYLSNLGFKITLFSDSYADNAYSLV